MQQRLPKPRIPSPNDIVSPLVSVENSVMGAIQSPFRNLGLPEPPRIPGPLSIVSQIVSQLPSPPQPPDLPALPRLNMGG